MEVLHMDNKQLGIDNLARLKMEIKGIDFPDQELQVYLLENGLDDMTEYDPKSNTNKKQIYQTALSVLESIANNPQQMKNYKTEDLSITHFHTNLLRQIDALNHKIRNMADDEYTSESDTTYIHIFK